MSRPRRESADAPPNPFDRVRIFGWVAFVVPLLLVFGIAGLAVLGYSTDVGLGATAFRGLIVVALIAALGLTIAFSRSPDETKQGISIALTVIFGLVSVVLLVIGLSALVYIKFEWFSLFAVGLGAVSLTGLAVLIACIGKDRGRRPTNGIPLLSFVLVAAGSIGSAMSAHRGLTASGGPGYAGWLGGALLLWLLILGLLVFAAYVGNSWTALILGTFFVIIELQSAIARGWTASTLIFLALAAAGAMGAALSFSMRWRWLDSRLGRDAVPDSRPSDADGEAQELCGTCGVSNASTNVFCRRCGTRLINPDGVRATSEPATVSDAASRTDVLGALKWVAIPVLAMFAVAGAVSVLELSTMSSSRVQASTDQPGSSDAMQSPGTPDSGSSSASRTNFFTKTDRGWELIAMQISGTSVVAEIRYGPEGNDGGGCFEGQLGQDSIDGILVGNLGQRFSIPIARPNGLVVLTDSGSRMQSMSSSEAARVVRDADQNPLAPEDCIGSVAKARANGLVADQ